MWEIFGYVSAVILTGLLSLSVMVVVWGLVTWLVGHEKETFGEKHTGQHSPLAEEDGISVLAPVRRTRLRRWKGTKKPGKNFPWPQRNPGHCGGNPPVGTLHRPGGKVPHGKDETCPEDIQGQATESWSHIHRCAEPSGSQGGS